MNKTHSSNSIIIFIALILSFSACTMDKIILNNKTTLISEFPEKDTVIFKEIFEYQDEPQAFTIADSTLIMLNFGLSGFFLNNYSLKTKKLSKGYLGQGRGPEEALSASRFGVTGNNLWVYDVTSKKFLIAEKTEVLADSVDVIFKHYPLQEQYIRMDFLDSLHFLAVNNLQTLSKIEEVNMLSGETTNKMGNFENIPDDVPLAIVKDAYTAYIFLNPSKSKAVLPYRFTDVVEIYDLDKGTNIAVKGPEQFDVIFKEEQRQGNYYMGKKQDTRKAFVNGAVTEKYIYLLYSGHSYTHEDWSYGRYIHVYDWQGSPIKKLALDRYIYAFIVSQDNKTIYSYGRETGYVLESNIKFN